MSAPKIMRDAVLVVMGSVMMLLICAMIPSVIAMFITDYVWLKVVMGVAVFIEFVCLVTIWFGYRNAKNA